VEERDVVTTLSDRRPVLADSTRAGLGPGSCVLETLALATALDARRPQAARPYPNASGVRYAGREAALSEPNEDSPPWDAA
jgi:hypothetical protein